MLSVQEGCAYFPSPPAIKVSANRCHRFASLEAEELGYRYLLGINMCEREEAGGRMVQRKKSNCTEGLREPSTPARALEHTLPYRVSQVWIFLQVLNSVIRLPSEVFNLE